MAPAKPSLLTVLPQSNCTIYYPYTTLGNDLATLLYYSAGFFFLMARVSTKNIEKSILL